MAAGPPKDESIICAVPLFPFAFCHADLLDGVRLIRACRRVLPVGWFASPTLCRSPSSGGG